MRGWICAAMAAACGVGVVVGCTGDDEVFVNGPDGGSFEAGPGTDSGPIDSAQPRLACGDAGGLAPHLLLGGGRPTSGELVAFNLATNTVAGRLSFVAEYGGNPATTGTDPWLLTQADEVIRLDAREPWKRVATWNVKGDDTGDAGNLLNPTANPAAIVAVNCDKAYVLRYNRNKIAVLDIGNPAGGVPTKYIDLASLLQTDDKDLTVEPTAAIHFPAQQRLYVLLGNIDLGRVIDRTTAPKLLCSATTSSIIAIDTTTDSIVSLGGSAPGGGIPLQGVNPPIGHSFVFDQARNKFLVLQAGCNQDNAGAAGPIIKREIDEVDLATGAATIALDLSSGGFPTTLAFQSATSAAYATFFGDGRAWNPTTRALGIPVRGGIDNVLHDGVGNIVGTHANYYLDGGSATDIVKAPFADPDAAAIVSGDPYTTFMTFTSGVAVWPRP